jgi:predicted Zn-dependent protease
MEQYRRAEMFMEMGDPAEAARMLEAVLAAEPGAAVRQRLALAYFASAQLAKAEAQLRELVAHDPTDHYAHHVLGRTLERQHRAAEALPHLRLAAAMAEVPDYRTAVERVAARVGLRGSARR